MLMLDAPAVTNCLDYETLVEELADMHRRPVGMVDELLMESIDDADNVNHFFIRAGWQAEEALGAKVITIFPRNNLKKIRPSIQAVYILFEAVNGTPVACLDGTALTYIKTAADSALGAKLLARRNMETLFMIGAGAMAAHLVRAHCQVQKSIDRVYIWNRTPEKAEALCRGDLTDLFPGVTFEPVSSIDDTIPCADLVCSATAATTPIIPGTLLREGSHLDLIGAYTPEMREADDECLRRASIFVDSRATTIHHIGEFLTPMAKNVISERDIRAELSELCLGTHTGRQSESEITLYKNGGGGHLDLMTARIIHKHSQR